MNKKFKSFFKIAVRKFFGKLGFHLIRSRFSIWQDELYSETSRSKIPKFVNLGSGSFYHKFWHNVDMPNEYYSSQQKNVDFTHDFSSRSKLPFEDGTVEIFYSSHVIEHLTDSDVSFLFSEVFRCLKPGGIFRITCPDMELQYEAYRNRAENFWAQPSPWGTFSLDIENRFLEHFATLLVIGSEKSSIRKIDLAEFKRVFEENDMSEFYDRMVSMLPENSNFLLPSGHCNWFSYQKMESMLRSCGFSNVRNSRYLQSIDSKLTDPRYFDGTCPELSLYVECKK